MHSTAKYVHHLFRSYIIFAFLLPSSIALPLLSPPATVHCVLTTWKDVLVFFLINYVAHAATAPSPPGAGWSGGFLWRFISLLWPFAGLSRAAILILSDCRFGDNELGKAISVGALTVVARTELWEPPDECGEDLVCASLPEQFKKDAGSPATAENSKPDLLYELYPFY
jgi:hypothetical protein